MAFVTVGYEKRNAKKKWNTLVGKVNNDREIQRMLAAQTRMQQNREIERTRTAKTQNADQINANRALSRQATRRRQQQRDYRVAYNEKPTKPRYEINEEQEIARFKQRRSQMLADRRVGSATATPDRPDQQLDEFGVPIPDYLQPPKEKLQYGSGLPVTETRFIYGLGNDEEEIKKSDENLKTAISNLNLSELEQDQLYAVLHKNSVINSDIFGFQQQTLIDEIRAGDFTRIADALGAGGSEVRKKLIEDSRELLASTIPGRGFDMEEQDPDIYEPLDWKALVNKPTFTMLIKAYDDDLDYMFHIGIDPITGLEAIIDNSGAFEMYNEDGSEKSIIDQGKKIQSKRARKDAILMLMTPEERTKFSEEWWTSHLNDGLKPDEVPRIPVFAEMFAQIAQEFNEEMFKRYIKGLKEGTLTAGTDFGNVASQVMTDEELQIGTMAFALAGGYETEATMPIELINERKALEANMALTSQRHSDGEITFEEAFAILVEQSIPLNKLEEKEQKVTERFKPVEGFNATMWKEIEEYYSDAKVWYDENTDAKLRQEAIKGFGPRGLWNQFSSAVLDPGGTPFGERVEHLTEKITSVPGISNAITGFLTDNAVTERLREELGRDPNSDEIFARKAADEKLMQEVKQYEAFLQLNGTMTERGFESFALGEIGGAYVGAKALMDITELGYTEVGHPIGEVVMPILGDLIYAAMYPVEQGLNVVEKGLQWEASALGLNVNVPGVGGFAQNVREVIAGDVDLFLGIDSTEVAGEILNPANLFFIIPFIGVGSKFGQAVRAGRYLDAVAILVDEMTLTGHTPEMIRGAWSGLRSVGIRGISETLVRSPGLKKNNVFQKMISNYGKSKQDEANKAIGKASDKVTEDSMAIRAIMQDAGIDSKTSIAARLKKYPDSLVARVEREINPEIAAEFKTSNFFDYKSIEKGDLAEAPLPNRGWIARGIGDRSFKVDGRAYEKGGFRVDFSQEYQNVLQVRRDAQLTFEESVGGMRRELDSFYNPEVRTSASGRNFLAPELIRPGTRPASDPIQYLVREADESVEKAASQAGQEAAEEVTTQAYKETPNYFPSLEGVYGQYTVAAKQTGKRAADAADVIAKGSGDLTPGEITEISKYSPSEIVREREKLEYGAAQMVLENGPTPNAEQISAFRRQAKRLEAVVNEEETRYAAREWRAGLDDTADEAALKSRYEELTGDVVERDLKLMTDEEIFQRHTQLLVEAKYRGGHIDLRFELKGRKREGLVFKEIENAEETLKQRGFVQIGDNFVKGNRKLGFASQENASRVAAEIEQAKRGSAYGGTIVGGIKNAGREKLLAVQNAALKARRGKTGQVRQGLDKLLDEIANELGNQSQLERMASATRRVHPDPERKLLPADADALRAEGAGEGAELKRADVDVDTATKDFTIRNVGADEVVDVAVVDDFTEVTLSGGLRIKAKRDPNTGGIFIETMMPRGGKKALRQLEDGLWELKIMADDQDIVIRGWVQPFGRGKSRVDLDEAFDIFERNGYLVERTETVRAGVFVDDTARPFKQFEYRPYIREGDVPDPARIDVAKNFEDQGDITTDFINVDDIVLPGMEPRNISVGAVMSGRPKLGVISNGVWEGTIQEAKNNLKLVHDDLFGSTSGLANARKAMSAEEGKQLRQQWAKWQRIIDNGGVEDARLEYLWRIQNNLEGERLAFQAKFSRHARVPEDEAIERFQRTIFDEAEETRAAKAVLDEERAVEQTVSQKFDELDEMFDKALKDNWDKIKIAEAGRTFNEQNVVAVQFEQAVTSLDKVRPRATTGKKNLLKFVADMDREAGQAGGGKTIKLSKSLEDMVEQKKLVDAEVEFLENQKIPQGNNFARDEGARLHALEQFEDYQSQLDETLTKFTRGDGELVDVAPSSVDVRELSDAEKYAEKYLVDPNRGDFGSSSIQERALLQDNRTGTDFVAGANYPEPQSGVAETFFDDVVDALIVRTRQISGNQKRQIFVREIAANESSTGMREVSVFGVSAKGAEKIKAGTWKGKNVGFPRDIAKFIKQIDGKTFKGNKKAFIDDIFRKNIVEAGWSPAQRGRMQYLKADAARLDVIGSKPSNKAQRMFYGKAYEDLVEGISYEVTQGIDELPNTVGRKIEAMNLPSKELPAENSLMTRDGAFIDIKGQRPANAIEDAWNQMGVKNPDWDEIKKAAVIHSTEEQAGKVTAALDATGFVSITRQGTGIKIEVQGVLSKKQAIAIKKMVDDGNYSAVDLIHSRVYGSKIRSNRSFLAKLKAQTDPDEIEKLERLGMTAKSTTKDDLYKKIDDLVDMELTPLKERVQRLDSVVDEAESFGTLPPNYSSTPNIEVQTHFLKTRGRTVDGSTPLDDGYGLIFPDGTIWVGRPSTKPPRTGKGARKFQDFTGTVKDDVRQAFNGSYDMTEQEMDEFLSEFLNQTGAMRFKSSGGEVQIIVNRPPTMPQTIQMMVLKNPEYERKGYKIQVLASDGAHAETIVSPKMVYQNFEEAQQNLAKMEVIVKDHKDGWEVLRVYRERQNVARKEASEISRLDEARDAGQLPKAGDAVDIENQAHQVTAKGTMTGNKKKSITYKDGRGKELTADVYSAHKQGPTQRPIVKNAIPDDAAPIVDEAEEITLAIREADGNGYIIDMDDVEYGMGGKGDDIFDGRGSYKVTERNAPVESKNIKEILDGDRNVVWERAAVSPDEIVPPTGAVDVLSDIDLTKRIRGLKNKVDNYDKRTTKYKIAVQEYEEADNLRKSRMADGSWMKDEAAPRGGAPEGMSAAERESRRAKMLKGSVDADILDDVVDDVPDLDTFRRALKNVAQRLEKGSRGSGGEVTDVEKAITKYLDTFDDPAKAADILFADIQVTKRVPEGIFGQVDDVAKVADDVAEVVPTGKAVDGAIPTPETPSVSFSKEEMVDMWNNLWDEVGQDIPTRKIRDPETDKLVAIKQPKNIDEAKSQLESVEARMGELEDKAADRGDVAIEKADDAIQELQEYYDDLEIVIDEYEAAIEEAIEEAAEAVGKAADDVPVTNPLNDPRPTNELKFRQEEITEIFDSGIDKRTTAYKDLLREKDQIEDILIYRQGRAKTTKKGDLGDEDIVEHLPEKGDAAPEGVLDDAAPEGVLDEATPEGLTDEAAEQGKFGVDDEGDFVNSEAFADEMKKADAGGPPEGVTDDIPPPGTGEGSGGISKGSGGGGSMGGGGAGGAGVRGVGGIGGGVPEVENALEEAAVLRQKGLDLINAEKATGDDFMKGMDYINQADAKEASVGITREVGSATGELTSSEKAIERLRATINAAQPHTESMVMAKGRKLLKMAPRQVATGEEKEAAKRTLKILLARRGSLTGKIRTSLKRRKELGDAIRTLKKGNQTPEIKAQIELKRWELIKEEQTAGLGVEHLAPVEQMQALSNEAARLGRIIQNEEAGFLPEEVGKYARKRFEDVDRSIEWIRKEYEEMYLVAEKNYIADQLYQTGMKAHRKTFEGIRDGLATSKKKLDDLISKGADKFGPEVQGVMKEQRELVESGMNKRKDLGDAVASLVFPKGSSGVLPSFSDFENIMTSRGFIGQAFEDVLNANIETWGLRTVLRGAKSVVGFVDNTFVLRSDALGRKILAMKKLENFSRTQDAKDAQRIMALGKLPFDLDDEGRWIWEGSLQGYLSDIFENPAKFKHLFNETQAEYVKVITDTMDNVRKFADFYGTEIPDIWKETNKVFRQVLHAKGGLIDFEKIKRWKTGKPDPFYERFYETLLDGAAKGVKYQTDPGKAVIHQMQAIRSFAINQAFMREVGKDFGVVKDVLQNKALKVTKDRWKRMVDWTEEYAKAAAGFLDGHTAKIPRIGLKPDSTGLHLPYDMSAIRERLLVNAKVTDVAKRTATAEQINRDALDLVSKYKVGFKVDDEVTHLGLKQATEDVAADVKKIDTRNTTKEAKRWGVRELNNEYPEGQALGLADQQWAMPNRDEILFLTDDLEYLRKHWQDSDFDKNFLLKAGKVAGVLRIPQTALDWGFPLINGLNNWGYDMYRSSSVVWSKEGSITAMPLLHPVFKLLGNKYKNLDSTSIWGESVWQSALAFTNSKGAAKYWTRENSLSPEIIAAYEKYARVAGLPHEFQEFGTFEKGEEFLLGKIPGAKNIKMFQRFQDSFTQYLNVSSYMYFKSLYHTVADNPKQLEELGALSRNMIGMHAGSELGIGAGQQAMERVALYAPSFTRASFAIMANATFQPTSFKGRQAIKSLAGLGESMIIITAAYSMIQQFEENGWDMDKMNWEDLGSDMVKAWTPGAGFWGIKGSTGIVGLGGAMRSNTQLIFRLLNRGMDWSPNVKSFVKGEEGFISALTSDFAIHPDKWLPNPFREGPIRTQTEVTIEARSEADDLGLKGDKKAAWINSRVQEWRDGRNKDGFFDHPFMQWYRGKAGIISGNAWDIISGHDFLGYTTNPLNLPERMKQFLPFYLQAALESRQGDWKNIVKTIGLEFLGARVIPPSASELKNLQYEKDSGYPIDELYELGPDGYQIHGGILYDLANNVEKFPDSVKATNLVAETSRGREQEYQKFRDERTRHYQERDAMIADLVADFDWNNDVHAKAITEAINEKYSDAQALVDEAKKDIFGDDGKDLIELWEGLDVDTMSPQAALDYAGDMDNWTDPITKDIEWDIREEFINKHVQRLPPEERAIWYENDVSHVGQSDTENYKAGKYDFVNEFQERKKTAGDDFGRIIDSGKYKGLTKDEGIRVGELIDTITAAGRIMDERGLERHTKKQMLEALNKAIPGNLIIQYAYMAQFEEYKGLLISTEKFDIIMENPDVVLFYPKTLTDWSITDRQRELWKEKWGIGGSEGGMGWRAGTRTYNDLYKVDGVRRNFGYDVDVTHRPRSFGIPTTTDPYTEAGETAVGAGQSVLEEGAGAFKSVGEELEEYLPSFLK